MKTKYIILIGIAMLAIFSLVSVGAWTLGLLNKEADLRTLISAKHEDNLSEYSNFKSKIKEAAQVSEKEAEVISSVIVGYSEGRGANGGGGLINAVHEAVPTVSVETLKNLQNIIVGSRNSWVQRQKELVSLSAEHNKLLNRPISGTVLSIFGKTAINIKIVATAQSKVDFESETETEGSLFK